MREDLPKDLRAQASALPGRPLKETSDLLLEAAKEIEDWRETVKRVNGFAEQGFEEAYKVITDLRNKLETQKEECEKKLEEGFEEAYKLLQEERAKNSPQEQFNAPVKRLRELDEHTLKEFTKIVTINDEGKTHEVPVIWADDGKILTLLEARYPTIKLPLMHLSRGDIVFVNGRINIHYTLKAWTLYEEDMNQIIEQVLIKFNPNLILMKDENGFLKSYYVITSIANNLEQKEEKSALKVLKYQFNLILNLDKF